MKTRFTRIPGALAAILLIAAFVIPAGVATSSVVSADPGIMRWDTVMTPEAFPLKNDVDNVHFPGTASLDIPMGSEILSMAVGNDGQTIAWIVRDFEYAQPIYAPMYGNVLYWSNTAGIAATPTRELGLMRATGFILGIGAINGVNGVPSNCYQVVIAPDNPACMAVSADGTTGGEFGTGFSGGPKRIYYTSDAGNTWDLAYDGSTPASWVPGDITLGPTEFIRNMDISVDYGGKRDIAFVTTTGAGQGHWFVRSSSGFNNWQVQTGMPAGTGGSTFFDYYAIKFSPTYNGDSSVALVAADFTGTYYNVAQRDLNQNTTVGWAFNNSINVMNVADLPKTSPTIISLNNAVLQLPSDFSGQSSSLRRAYISLDAMFGPLMGTTIIPKISQDGIYRIDDTTVYVLMDTTTNMNKSIYSIAYFGTYASGKLLAGERLGFPCTATVPTWFTDSPTTCPIPCWYPALKPTTGAAGLTANCAVGNNTGVGAALVGWNADGSLGLVSTGSLPAEPSIMAFPTGAWGPANPLVPLPPFIQYSNPSGGAWWGTWSGLSQLANAAIPSGPAFSIPGPIAPLFTWSPVHDDESAFAISRNNGETWNQLALIDTTIDWFNDVAVAPDCTTIYLASVSANAGIGCNEFDSVWRATINPNVAAPLPAVPPIGMVWERVFCHTTSGGCTVPQSELPILRVVESCTDKPTGEIVGWAAQNATATTSTNSGGVMAWSPDYGDYWATVTPRYPVQDFTFESSTTMYVLSPTGVVQRLPYTGTSWSTNLPNYDSQLLYGHTIAAMPDGKVLVGAGVNAPYPMAYSLDQGVTLSVIADPIAGHGNEHVIFDTDFADNSFIYMGDDSGKSDTAANGGMAETKNSGGTAPGTVYRNSIPANTRWVDGDMMSRANGNGYVFSDTPALWWGNNSGTAEPANDPPHPVGQYGLVQAWTGTPQAALYSAHDSVVNSSNSSRNVTSLLNTHDSAVCRTLVPRNGIPKPGIQWSCLDVFAPLSQKGVYFTLEPSSLKACGCCTLDTNTTLYAIDDESGGRWNGHYLLDINSGTFYDPGVYDKLGYSPYANQGMLWAYTDCLAKKGPVLKGPADQFLVGADPVTGRNQQIDLSWEQLCLTVWYQLQIAKDSAFTLRINPAINYGNTSGPGQIKGVTGSILIKMDSTNNTSPAAWIPPGALPEAGAIYYWRIRSAKSATSQIANSPWSAVNSFTVKAGFIVNTPYYGVQLLSPANGGIGIPTKPTQFSWSPWQDATKYEFDLAKDPEFQQMVTTANTTTSAYSYSGSLDYATSYFWRVKALEVNGQSIPSDWSATFSFQTSEPPAPPAPAPAEPATPIWVWVIIAIGAILVIVTLVLTFKTRRV
ncbi:MAG: hypothetical protein ABSB31_08345 [Dehalococcoidia bacterium]|jgi:hypothetical protein